MPSLWPASLEQQVRCWSDLQLHPSIPREHDETLAGMLTCQNRLACAGISRMNVLYPRRRNLFSEEWDIERRDGWMNDWTNDWTNEWMTGWINGWMNKWMHKWSNIQVNKWMDETGRQLNERWRSHSISTTTHQGLFLTCKALKHNDWPGINSLYVLLQLLLCMHAQAGQQFAPMLNVAAALRLLCLPRAGLLKTWQHGGQLLSCTSCVRL